MDLYYLAMDTCAASLQQESRCTLCFPMRSPFAALGIIDALALIRSSPGAMTSDESIVGILIDLSLLEQMVCTFIHLAKAQR